MSHLQSELAAAANQQGALEKVIADLDTQISTTEAQVTAAQAELNLIGSQLSVAEDNLAVTRQQLGVDRRQLGHELVVMYKAQNASNSFTNFLNSGDFNTYWQHVVDVHRLGVSAQRLVDRVTTEEATIQADVDDISLKKAQQTTLLATLHGIVVQLNSTLATRQQAHQQLIDLQARDQVLLAQAEQAAKEKDAEIARLKAEQAAARLAGGGNGHFVWPMNGAITQNFGCTPFTFEPYDANCAERHFHSGLDISNTCGTPIVAGDAGIAHLYDDSYGYGRHVIIVHGNGWVSLYGHMSGFAIGEGQRVGRGQRIGWEGSTGNSTGCHVHFEVDLNGVPRNPLAYLS
jgi:murein DD-endopeptidase MepM/ murein hydrolase activator NlpD